MKCESNYVEKEVMRIEKVKDGVILTLSEDEAKHLFSVTGSIGGQGPVRQTMDRIYTYLYKHFGKIPTSPFTSVPQYHGDEPKLR